MAYPFGMRFPHAFRAVYPFRGRGMIARWLYWMNRLRLDQLFLKRVRLEGAVFEETSNVAYFWPSALRSCGRFYGYVVEEGRIVQYLKLATDKINKDLLLHEVESVKIAESISDGLFRVPSCKGVKDCGHILIAKFDPIPNDAVVPPMTKFWYDKAIKARDVIAKAGYSHGDFHWHNFKAAGDDLWVFDWEEMSAGRSRLVDEITLDFGLKIFKNGESIEQVKKEFQKRYCGSSDVWAAARAAVKDICERKIALWRQLKEFSE